MQDPIEPILLRLPDYLRGLEEIKETILANAVMLGEIPAPTFQEAARIQFVSDRFTEAGLEHISTDEMGNAAAILPGSKGRRAILVSANADCVFFSSVDHSMTVSPDRITGPGISNNAIGLATLALLPTLLEKLDIRLEADLILLASTRALGAGDIAGMRFFLENFKRPLDAGICIRGVHLGRLSYNSLGMLRGEIRVQVGEESHWRRSGGAGAITVLNRIISRLQAIPLPREPMTQILLGSVNAGTTFGAGPTWGLLRFEVRTEQKGMVEQQLGLIQEIVDEMEAENDVGVTLTVISRRQHGGIPFGHPMVRAVREVSTSLGIEPVIAPSTGELCALIDKEIPAVTLGITDGDHINEPGESIRIGPIYRGVAQIAAVLEAFDDILHHDED